ncbi:MAG: hypothetical protein K0S04_868 [Herbinix sp.]|jgi:hypothetical protein|nr:hypothetical protein [Herbinix sp.]
MENNPFLSMVQNIRDDNRLQTSVSYRLGTVASVTPFTVDVAGIRQQANSLLKNHLITDFEVGSQLLLFPIENEQRYIILCRVVST